MLRFSSSMSSPTDTVPAGFTSTEFFNLTAIADPDPGVILEHALCMLIGVPPKFACSPFPAYISACPFTIKISPACSSCPDTSSKYSFPPFKLLYAVSDNGSNP